MLRLSASLVMVPNKECGYDFFYATKAKTLYHIYYGHTQKRFICTCRDFNFRRLDEGGNCKHISELVREFPTQAQIAKMSTPPVRSYLLVDSLAGGDVRVSQEAPQRWREEVIKTSL